MQDINVKMVTLTYVLFEESDTVRGHNMNEMDLEQALEMQLIS